MGAGRGGAAEDKICGAEELRSWKKEKMEDSWMDKCRVVLDGSFD